MNYAFYEELPLSFTDKSNLEKIGCNIIHFSNKLIQLCALESILDCIARDVKRHGSKEDYEEYIDKRKALAGYKESMIIQYQALKKVITVKQEIDNDNRREENQ